MANLQIKGMDDGLYAQIKALAAAQNRSVSGQVVNLIKEYLAKGKSLQSIKTPAQVLLELSGSWSDDRPAEEIAADIKAHRKNSKKLANGF
jgi:hypothetical protein